MKIGFSSLYFVDEWFLYFVNKVFFVYFVDKMVLTSHKPGDIIFNNDLKNLIISRNNSLLISL